jgi:hypothetical protein
MHSGGWMLFMAAPGRRRRMDIGETKPLQARVPPEVYQRAHRAAETLRISVSEYLELLIRRDELDESGRPVWGQPATLKRPRAQTPGNRLSA